MATIYLHTICIDTPKSRRQVRKAIDRVYAKGQFHVDKKRIKKLLSWRFRENGSDCFVIAGGMNGVGFGSLVGFSRRLSKELTGSYIIHSCWADSTDKIESTLFNKGKELDRH